MSESQLTIGFLRRGYSATGGVEVDLKGLARGLSGKGYRPVLFGTGDWPATEWPGGVVLRCSGRNLSEYAADAARCRTDSGIRIDLMLSVEKVPGCDIYRTDEGLHAAWLDQRAHYLHPLARIFQRISPRHREKLRLEREIFKAERTLRVISISEKITREISEYYGYPADRITLIRNGVTLGPLPGLAQKYAARRKLGVSDSERIVLFVGTGWERKGLSFAIRAMERLRDPKARLLVAGKGRVRRYRSPVVRFLGPVKDMESVYAAADLLVVPSLFEPFSLAALEGLGSGLPVITSRAVGASEIMKPGVHGEILATPSDISVLTGAIHKWLSLTNDPQKAAEIRSECASLAAEYSLERNLRETLAVIGELAEEKRRRGRSN